MLARRGHAIKLEFPPLQQLLLDCLRGLGVAPGLQVDLHRTPSIIHTPAGGMLGTGRGGDEAHLNHERLRDVLPEPLELPGSILHLFHLEHKLQQAAAALVWPGRVTHPRQVESRENIMPVTARGR